MNIYINKLKKKNDRVQLTEEGVYEFSVCRLQRHSSNGTFGRVNNQRICVIRNGSRSMAMVMGGIRRSSSLASTEQDAHQHGNVHESRETVDAAETQRSTQQSSNPSRRRHLRNGRYARPSEPLAYLSSTFISGPLHFRSSAEKRGKKTRIIYIYRLDQRQRSTQCNK